MAVQGGALAAMLTDLFADPNMAVDGVLSAPEQPARKCRVLFRSAADAVALSLAQYGSQAEHDMAEVLVSQIKVRPVRGTLLRIGKQTYRAGSAAEPARNGLTWRLTLSEPDEDE